jgi:tRNA(adenine34) deaminase
MNDEYYMELAINEAKKAFAIGEVPIGAVLVWQDKVIAKAHNKRESNCSPIGHAEILVIMKGAKKLNSWKLNECTLYVTVEPCLMCAGAIINSRISRVIYGIPEPKFGAVESLTNLFSLSSNHKVSYSSGIREDEIKSLMKQFFSKLREK